PPAGVAPSRYEIFGRVEGERSRQFSVSPPSFPGDSYRLNVTVESGTSFEEKGFYWARMRLGYCENPIACSGCGSQPDGCGGVQQCGECFCPTGWCGSFPTCYPCCTLPPCAEEP